MHEKLFIETKLRANNATVNLFKVVMGEAKAESKTPVVAICEKFGEGYLLVLRPQDLCEVAKEYGKAKVIEL